VLGERAAGFEVKIRVLVVGELPVHLLDLSLQLRRFDERRGVEPWQVLGRLCRGSSLVIRTSFVAMMCAQTIRNIGPTDEFRDPGRSGQWNNRRRLRWEGSS
jgi:hypothetical protein